MTRSASDAPQTAEFEEVEAAQGSNRVSEPVQVGDDSAVKVESGFRNGLSHNFCIRTLKGGTQQRNDIKGPVNPT